MAVITPFGLFEFLVLQTGKRNGAQTCQRYVPSALYGLHFVYAFIDGILVASENEETLISL